MIGTFLGILGSLGMFIFGMKVMSEPLQKLSGERLRAMMHNRDVALGTGFLVMCLVQSSSVAGAITITMAYKGRFDFPRRQQSSSVRTSAPRSPPTSRMSSLMRVVAEFEDICDCGYRLVLLAGRKSRKGRDLPEATLTEIREFSTLLFTFMDSWSGFLGREVTVGDMDTAIQLEKQIDQARKKFRRESMLRMQNSGDAIKGRDAPHRHPEHMESIGNHSLNILRAMRHAD